METMSSFLNPEDMAKMTEQLEEMRASARELHGRAMLIGYNVGAAIGRTLADLRVVVSRPLPEVSQRNFLVWRVDQPSDTAKAFNTVAEVYDFLAHARRFPRYCLELEGNPRLVVETEPDGRSTRITDKISGEHFAVRTEDLEGMRKLCIHAETPPTIGDWTPE